MAYKWEANIDLVLTSRHAGFRNDSCVGRPLSSATKDNVMCFEDLIREGKNFVILVIKFNFLLSVVHEIIHKKLGYQ